MARGGGDFPGEAGFVSQVLWSIWAMKNAREAVPLLFHGPAQSGPKMVNPAQ